jgi:hypothetical protein
LFERGFHADTVFGPQALRFAVLDEPIGPADAHDRRIEP